MSLTEWILGSALVFLLLSLWAQSHRLTLVREELERHACDPFKHIGNDIRLTAADWRHLWSCINAKQDKPLLRRKTDKDEVNFSSEPTERDVAIMDTVGELELQLARLESRFTDLVEAMIAGFEAPKKKKKAAKR